MLRSCAVIGFFVFGIAAAQAGTVRVSYGDLDLHKAGDVQMLRARILNAAETACGPDFHTASDLQHSASIDAAVNRRICVGRAAKAAEARLPLQGGAFRLAEGND